MSLSHWATWSGFYYTALSGGDFHMYVFFLIFYIVFFVHPSHLSVYYICTVQRVHYQINVHKCHSFLFHYLPCIKLTTWQPEMGKVFGFIWFKEYNTSEWGPGMATALWLLLVRGAARLPLPHHRAVRYLFGWFKRLSSRTLRLYKNT